MTIVDAYNAVLIELNKVQAPSILLSDFVYFYNKAVLQYINKRYSFFEHTQLLTDDLRVLVKTTEVPVTRNAGENDKNDAFHDGYLCELPEDYMHILNCVCLFENTSKHCENNTIDNIGASKLDTLKWASVITNYYMKPSWKKPYYYITNLEDPEFVDDQSLISKLRNYPANSDRLTGKRYGNSTKPVMQIKCGKLDNLHPLKKVYIEYLRYPEYLTINHIDLDKVDDETRSLEFPDYVVYEIINNIVLLIMENSSNARMTSHMGVSTSIIEAGTTAK